MLLLKETRTSSGCTSCHTNMLQTVPLIHLFLGREEALRNAFFTFQSHILWSLAGVYWLVFGLFGFMGFFFYYIAWSSNVTFWNWPKESFMVFSFHLLSPSQSPHQHITLEEVLWVKHNEINEVLYLLAFYE